MGLARCYKTTVAVLLLNFKDV